MSVRDFCECVALGSVEGVDGGRNVEEGRDVENGKGVDEGRNVRDAKNKPERSLQNSS